MLFHVIGKVVGLFDISEAEMEMRLQFLKHFRRLFQRLVRDCLINHVDSALMGIAFYIRVVNNAGPIGRQSEKQLQGAISDTTL